MESTQDLKKPKFIHNQTITWQVPDEGLGYGEFWYVELKDTKEEIREVYKFNYIGLYTLLEMAQIGRYRNMREETILVYAKENIAAIIKPEDVKDFIIRLAVEEENYQLLEMIYRGATSYLNESRVLNCKFIDLKFLENTAKKQYLFFANAAYEITKASILQKTYPQLEGYVWQEQVAEAKVNLDANAIKVIKKDNIFHMEVADDIKESDYWKYLYYTSFYHWRSYQEKANLPEKDRETELQKLQHEKGILSKLTALGYMLCGHKDPAAAKAVICMDAKMSEVGESNGRTGKSIFGRSIEKMLKTYYINGRDTKIFEGAHPYDGLDESYKMVFIDDADQNLQFGLFYTLITGDMQVNTKNAIKFTIPFSRSPKLLITTNHAIKGSDASSIARQFLVGFADYFSDERSPADVFGRRLFDDWDYAQWNSFYQICASAIQLYLQYGFIEAETEDLRLRRLRQEIGENFITWAETYFTPNDEIPLNIGIDVPKKAAYDNFGQMFDTYVKKNVNIRLFKKKLQQYASFKGWYYNQETNGEDIKSNGMEYFRYDMKKIEK
jgi:DNA primase